MTETGLRADLRFLYGIALVATLGWTLLIMGSHLWLAEINDRQAMALSVKEARANINKDKAFRLWATRHGGVYVPPDERTPPNPYLSHVPDRDVVTTTGKNLTLMNPAYALRQLIGESEELYGIRGRITSLTPLNPDNAPDAWEEVALGAFERGRSEVAEVTKIDGASYLRLMQPIMVEAGCLKCHRHQGYDVGDVRGGISVAVAMKPFVEAGAEEKRSHALVHGLIWLLGLGGIGGATFWRRKYVVRRSGVTLALKEGEERFRQLYERAPLAYHTVDAEGLILDANRAWFELTGFAREDVIGQDVSSFLTPNADSALPERNSGGEFDLRCRDGSTRLVSLDCRRDAGEGEGVQRRCILSDVTERERMARDLERNFLSQKIVAEIAHLSLQPVSLRAFLDQALELVLSNETFDLLNQGSVFLTDDTGQKLEMVAERNLHRELLSACARVDFGYCLCGRAAASGRVVHAECVDGHHEMRFEGMLPHGHYVVPIKDGDTVLGVLNLYVREGHAYGDEEVLFLNTIADTLASAILRKKSEDALRASSDRLAHAQRIARLGNWEWDIVSGRLWWPNETFHIFGLEPGRIPITYEAFLHAIHPDDRALVKASIQRALAGEPYDVDHRVILPDGSLRIVHEQGEVTFADDGRPLKMSGTVQDVTEERETQAQLIQVSKLASLGEMATGIAHELNQPLNIIRLTADSLEMAVEAGTAPSAADLREKLATVSSQTVRAATIIDHMRAFGRKAPTAREPVSPSEVAVNATTLLREQLRLHGIELEVEAPNPCRTVLGNAIQLEQVVLNFLTNARDAINQRADWDKGGERRITVRVVDDAVSDEVLITVADTGSGIPEAALERIFEPFFTTKEVGKGTGLGLSVSYGIITEMGGTIRAENTVGDGAVFTVVLPVGEGE